MKLIRKGLLCLMGAFVLVFIAPLRLDAAGSTVWKSILRQTKQQAPSNIALPATTETSAPATTAVPKEEGPSLLDQENISHRMVGAYHELTIDPDKVKVKTDQFLDHFKVDLKLRDGVDQMAPVSSRFDNLKDKTWTVTRLQHMYKGTPVMGDQTILRSNADGQVESMIRKFVSDLNIDTNPTISDEAKLTETARRAVPAQVYSWDNDSSKAPKWKKVITFKDFKSITAKNARLAWQANIVTEKPSQSYRLEIDAQTGEVLNKISNFWPSLAPVPDDTVNWNENDRLCQLTIPSEPTVQSAICDKGKDGLYRLMCHPDSQNCSPESCTGASFSNLCAAPVKMIDLRTPNPQAQTDKGEDPSKDYVFVDSQPSSGGLGEVVFGDDEDIIGNTLYYYMLNALAYFYERFPGWAGFDGQGKLTILNYVTEIETPGIYSFYDSDSKSISFDSSIMNVNAASADFIGRCSHELAHGILDAAVPDLVNTGETAALNESFAETFSELARYRFKNYNEGSFHYAQGGPIENPNSNGVPDTYQGYYYIDNVDCATTTPCYHTPEGETKDGPSDPYRVAIQNSYVQNFMFYLLANGGKGTNDKGQAYEVAAIGPDLAEQLAFRTMLSLLPFSTFSEARKQWIFATDSFPFDSSGSGYTGLHDIALKSVKGAWDAVGVTDDTSSSVNPAPGDQNVSPWPATLSWHATASNDAKISWQVQISSSPHVDEKGNFDGEDTQTAVVTPKDSTALPSHSNSSSFSPVQTDFQQTIRTGGSKTTSYMASFNAQKDFNLKPLTNYFWHIKSKMNSPVSPNQQKVQSVPSSDDWDKIEWSPSPPYEFRTGPEVPELISPKAIGGTAKINSSPSEFNEDLMAAATDTINRSMPEPNRQPSTATMIRINPWTTTFKWKFMKEATQYFLRISENSGPLSDPESFPPNPPGPLPTPTPATQKEPQLPLEKVRTAPTVALFGEWFNISEVPVPLKVDTTYYWGALPTHFDDIGTRQWIKGGWSNSGQGQMVVTSKPKGVLDSPINGEPESSWGGFKLKWKKVDGAAGYRVIVSQYVNSPDHIVDQVVDGGDTTSYTMPSPPASMTGTLYWWVIPLGPVLPKGISGVALPITSQYGGKYGEEGDQSDPGSFKLDESLTKPDLYEPLNGNVIDFLLKSYPKGFPFEWQIKDTATASMVKSYTLSFYRRNSDGTCDTTALPGLTFSNLDPTKLNPTNKHVVSFVSGFANDHDYDRCWRVQAIGPQGQEGELPDPFLLGIGPDKPDLTGPADKAKDVDPKNVTFQWNSEWAPDGYYLQVTEKDNGKLIWTVYTNEQTKKYIPPQGFDPGKEFEWYVEGRKKTSPGMIGSAGYNLAKSDTRTFTTACAPLWPLAPSVSCVRNSSGYCISSTVTFQWAQVTGAKSYDVQIASAGDQSGADVWHISTSGLQAPWSAPSSDQYWVQVRPINACGQETPADTSGKYNTIFNVYLSQ